MLLRSSVWITALSLAGSALGLANQLLLAYRFGASRTVDGLLVALSVPTFVGGLTTAMVSFSVVPRVVAASADPDRHAAYVKAMGIAMLGAGAAVTLSGWVLAPLLSGIGGARHADPTTIAMARIAWVATGLQLVAAYLGAVSNAASRFVRPAVAGLGPYLGMLGANYGFGASHGIVVLPVGLAAGTAAALAFLSYSVRAPILAPRRAPLPWREVRAFLASSPSTAIAMTVFSAYAVVDAHLAPRLGEATLSYLGYGQRIVIALGNLAIAGPSAVLVPHLARAYADGRVADFARDSYRALAWVAGIATLVAVLTGAFAADLVGLVFQRGAFDASAASHVAAVLPVMLAGMVPMLSVVILFRAIFCMGQTRFPAMAAVLWVGLYYAAASLLGPRFRAVGMAYAYALSWGVVLACTVAWLAWATRAGRSSRTVPRDDTFPAPP